MSLDKSVQTALGRFSNMVRRTCAILIVLAACFNPHAGFAQSKEEIAAQVKEADVILWSDSGPEDFARARQILENLAGEGDDNAQRVLGQHLLNGWVLEQDVDQGRTWLEKAANAGNAAAQTELGRAYFWGKFAPQDRQRGAVLLASAADKGDVTAQRVLGEQLIGGWNMPRDVARGRHLLEQAIAGGDDEAHVAMGQLLMSGTGLETDKRQALEHFEAAAKAGNGHGLAIYGKDLMWRFTAPAEAEAILERAGELGASEAWVSLAHGAMYGYLGGGSVSRAKFDGYAAKARAAGEEEIAVLEATRNMWGINMRADGPKTLAQLRTAADYGNSAAAGFLIALLRDGNRLNIRRDLKAAQEALDRYGAILGETAQAQYALTLKAKAARTPKAYAPVAAEIEARPDLKSLWFGEEIYKANPNVAFYILQKRFHEDGSYTGPLNGFATRATLRAVYGACRGLDHPERCDDNTMRSDIIGALLAK